MFAEPGTAWAEELVPPLASASPRLRFHRGEIANGQPRIDPSLPAIPGPVSDWYVAQWQHRQYLAAGDLISTSTKDGVKHWAFATADGESSLRIEQASDGGARYTLDEKDGELTEGGGANLFLATSSVTPDATFDRRVTLDISVRVTKASSSYNSLSGRESGAVQAMAFVGLGLVEHDPAGAQFVFMQVALTGSYEPTGKAGTICTLAGGNPRLLYSPPAGAADLLPFRSGAARDFHIDLSAAINGMLAHPYSCGPRLQAWRPAQRTLRNWRLGGVYVGLEAQNEDHRKLAAFHGAQGSAELGIELDRFSIHADPD